MTVFGEWSLSVLTSTPCPHSIPPSMSPMKMLNSTSPNTSPWDIPLVTGLHWLIELLTTTFWVQPSSQLLICWVVHPSNQYLSSLNTRMCCGTVSNAFASCAALGAPQDADVTFGLQTTVMTHIEPVINWKPRSIFYREGLQHLASQSMCTSRIRPSHGQNPLFVFV